MAQVDVLRAEKAEGKGAEPQEQRRDATEGEDEVSYLIERLDNEHVREAFNDLLGYGSVKPNDVRALEGFLAIEYARHERDGHHMEMRPSYRKKHQPRIEQDQETGGIRSAFLRVSGFYFSGREAVSFNEDGFVGFAGWADRANIKPFLRAFVRWMRDWMGCEVEVAGDEDA